MISTPNGDNNKYYILSQPEWDFDQVFTTVSPDDDTTWVKPDSSLAIEMADGYDAKMLLSVGPINLLPGASVRSIYTLFVGEFVHTDPANGKNLTDGNYLKYYDNLFFDIFLDNAQHSTQLVENLIVPTNAPLGLQVDYLNNDTTLLSWDNWVFPDVTGYNFYITKLPDSLLFNPQLAVGNLKIDMFSSGVDTLLSNINEGEHARA